MSGLGYGVTYTKLDLESKTIKTSQVLKTREVLIDEIRFHIKKRIKDF